MEGLAAALPRIHIDVQDRDWRSERQERPGNFGFYAGVTRAYVVAAGVSGGQVEGSTKPDARSVAMSVLRDVLVTSSRKPRHADQVCVALDG